MEAIHRENKKVSNEILSDAPIKSAPKEELLAKQIVRDIHVNIPSIFFKYQLYPSSPDALQPIAGNFIDMFQLFLKHRRPVCNFSNHQD